MPKPGITPEERLRRMIAARRTKAAGRRKVRDDDLVAKTRTATLAGGAYHPKQAAQDFGVDQSEMSRSLSRLADEGRVIRLPIRTHGYVTQEPLPAPAAATLAGVVALASLEVSESVQAPSGRQALTRQRRIEALTPGQYKDIERMARDVAAMFPGAGGDPDCVPASVCAWDNKARSGEGDWRLAKLAADAALRRHQSKSEKKGKTWHAERAKHTVHKATGAARNLCILANTMAWVPSVARSVDQAVVHDASWGPTIARWLRYLSKHQRLETMHRASIRRAIVTLATFATRLRGHDVESTDWPGVTRAIEAAFADGELKGTRYSETKRFWDRTCAWLNSRGVHIADEWQWPHATKARQSLVPNGAFAAVADSVTQPALDFGAWLSVTGEHAGRRGLVEGPYGVRALVQWRSLRGWRLQDYGLPERVWAFDRPDRKNRQGKSAAPRTWARETMIGRLGTISRVAGFADRQGLVDVRRQGLEALSRWPVLAQWVASMGNESRIVQDTLWTMGDLCAGFVGARLTQRLRRAQELLETATRPGDAMRLRRLVGQLQAAVSDARDCYARCYKAAGDMAGTREASMLRTRQRNLAIARAWSGSDGRPGIHKIFQLRDLLLMYASELAEGRTLEEQAAGLMSGTFVPSARWATQIRNAAIFTLGGIVPLRARSIAGLTIAMWKASGPDLWDGAVTLEIPESLMKSGRPFNPSVIAPTEVGTEASEADFCRALWRLYLMPTGARHRLLMVNNYSRTGESVEGERWQMPSPYLFPSCVGSGMPGGQRTRKGQLALIETRRARLAKRTLTDILAEAVERYAEALHVDIAALRAIYGAKRFHTIRRLYGTHHAPNDLQRTSRRLDHMRVQFTLDVYVAQDESAGTMPSGYQSAPAADPRDLRIAALEQQIGQMAAALAAQAKVGIGTLRARDRD